MATEIGIIKALVGTATATATDGTIRNLQVGDKVYQNDLITTGAAGAVEIEFADGSTMDMGRSSQAMLDLEVFDPSAAATETAETTETTDDIAAIQQALLEGEDPTVAGEATAAGAGAGGGNEGGHDFVVREYLNPEVTPENGFDTTGPGALFLQSEEELNELDDVPTAGTTTVTLDEDDLVSGQTLDLGAAGDEFLAFLNGDFGISAFSIGNPVDGLFNSPSNGVGDERTELGDDPADGQFLSGSLIAEYGFNGPSPTTPIIFNVISGSDVTDSEGNPVTSGGQQVKYWVSADGLTVIGYIAGEYGPQLPPQINDELAVKQQVFDGCEGPGNDYPEMAQIVFTAQLTPTAEGGNFLVGIFAQFDHQAPDYENGEFVFENNMFLNLGFTISDADGDTATGTLQINVDDDSPVRAGDEESLATQTGVAYEDGLSLEDGDLSEGNPNNAVAMTITSDASDAEQSDIESFLGLSAGALEPAVDSNGGDGNATNGSAAKTALTVEAGDIISFNWSFDNNDGGSFNDFAFVVINGEVFELADSNGGNLAANPFTYEVTADGEITIGFGQMNVGDQISDSSLSVSDLTLNGNPVNGGFDGALTGWDTLGNVSDSDSLFNSDVTTGNLNSVVNMGADGPGSFALLQPSENEFEQALFQAAMDSLPTLSSKGEAVSYSINEYGELVATAGEGEDAREVFTLTVNEDGTWTFDLNDQLDHVGGETAEENFSLVTLGENGEPNGSVDSIDFTQLLQIRDFDGDQLIITEDDAGMFSIAIKDDIPVATGETVSATVDEDDIRTELSTGNNPYDNDGDGSYTGEPITIFGYTTDFFNIGSGGPATTTGSVASLVSFGADEEGTFSLGDNFAGLEAQALTSKGDELSFEVQGDTLIASADGRAVFTLELEDNGEFTFTLYDQLDHAAGEGQNNLPLDLSTVIQATDNDNDTITLDSGFTIDVTDDVPEQAGLVPDIGIVEEEALPAGNQEENDGSFFGFPIDGYPDTAVATGSLQDQVSVGADESVTFGFATDLSGLPELTSNGLSVNYEVNGDTLTASTDSGDVFTLQLESNGSYTFTLKSAIDHAPGQGENIQVIDFSSVVEATDFDGDTLTLDNDFYIKVVDDIPVATDETVSVTVDEDDIRTDLSTGNDPYDNDGDGSYTGEPITIFGYTTDFFNIGSGGPATTTGSVAALVSFGADENGTFSLGSNFTTLEGLGLTSQGDELSFEVNGDTLVASADGRAVFTLELDDNGDFTFSLYDQLDHATGNGENNLSLDLSSVIQATDSDNDTITLDSGFTINVTDDVPEQDGLSPDIGIVEEEALPNGNQEQNDLTQTINLGIFGTYTIPIDGWLDTAVATGSLADQVNFGADEPGSFYFSENFDSLVAQELTSNDEPLSFGVDGDTLYAVAGQTAIFSLKLESNGEYTFTLMGPLDHPDSEVVENLLSIDFSDIVIAEDFDGDTLTLNQDFFIKIVDDSPVVTPYDVNTMRIISDDETVAGLNGNVGEGFGTSDGTGTDSKEFNQSKTLQFSAGADGGTVAWNLDNTSVDDGTAGISFSVDANGTLILTQEQNGEPVQIATVTLDETTGDYVYTQTANVLHTPGNAENEASFTLGFTVTDGDGDTADGKLTLLIDDDSPTITPYEVNTMRIISDDDTVAGFNGNPGGVGDSQEYNQVKTLQFSVGADGGTVAWNTDTSSVEDATAGITFQTDADGSLLIMQDQGGESPVQVAIITLDEDSGDYVYTQTANVLHTPGNNENEASFKLGFTVTDGDGDTADGYVTLLIDDDTPTVADFNVNTMRIISDDDSVAGLDGNPGGVGDSNQFNLNGTLQFSAGADGGTVAWNLANTSVDDATAGISFSVDADGTLILTQEQDGVPVQIATVTLDETTGDYVYTQTDNLLHTPGNDENNADFTLGFTVTDGDGDTANGNLTLRIDDDTPVITAQSIQILSESFENFADINGDNFTVVYGEDGQIIGNNGIVWNVNAAGIEIQSGNVGDSEASDGNVHAELDTDNNDTLLAVLSTEIDLPTSDATLSFDYKPRPDNEDDSDMQVSLGDKVVTINSDAAGNITFGGLPEGVTASQETNPTTGWTTITLSFTGLSTASSQTLAFEGLGNANEFGAYLDNINLNASVALTVDESALADGNGEAGATTSASYDFSGFFTAAFGADGPADECSESYSLNLNGEDVASGLYGVDNTDTSTDNDGYGQGAEIVLNQVGDQIVGSAGGVDYFTISVNAETGQVTLTQLNNVWHADTTNPDDSQGMVLDAGVLSLVKAITDADEDSAEAALDLSGVNFNFEDDAPTIAAEQPAQPYLLTITNEGGDAGYNNTYGYYIKGENGEPVSGEIIWANVKDNDSAEITIEVTDPSDIGFFIIPDGADLNALNNGDAVTFEQDGEGNWQVVLDGTPLSGQDTNVLFDNSDLNPGNADALQDNGAVGNQNWEDIIGGDNDFNDVNINVSINQLGAITVDETDIGNGDPSNATDSQNFAASFTAAFGADGPGTVGYSLTANTEVETGLVDTLSDKAVQLRETADGVEGYITSDDAQDFVVFTVTVDENGEVTLTQLRAVEHDDVTDPDEANSPAILNAGALALVATATDADGDTASDSIDLGVLMAFEDDGPSIGEQAANSVDEGNTTTGTLVFDAGQDGGGISHIDGTELEFGQDGFSQEIELDHGTIKVKANGEYSYTVDSGSLEQDEVENFNFTVTDGDGDTAQGAVAITIVNAQVADVITLNDVTVSEGDGTATITGSVENPVTGTPLVITLDNGATITIPVGDTSAESTPFAVQGDDVYLDGESYTVEVTGATGGNYSSLDTSDDATVTVNDTIDTTTVTLNDVTVDEDGTITYSASVDNAPQGDLTLTLSNGVVIVIADGLTTGSSAPQPAQGDDAYLDADSVNVSIDSATGGNYENLDTTDTATVTINDTIDTTTVTLNDVTVDEDGTITYSASVDNAPQGDLTITLSNDVVIVIGDGLTTGSSAPQPAQGDDVFVDADSFNVSIDSATGGNYENLDTTDTATVTINDTIDTVTATLTASPAELSEDGGDITYTITLTGGPGDIDPNAALTFTLANNDPDGQPITIIINPGSTTGSVDVNYDANDVTAQTAITNNIASVVNGEQYEDLDLAGETSVGVDTTPEITNLTTEAQGGDAIVDEDDLAADRASGESAGTDGSDSTTVQGSFNISAADGVGNLTVGSYAVITNGVFNAGSFATPMGNTLNFTGYNPTTGEVSYEYTLNDNTLDHGFANNGENNVFENFDMVLTDTDNDEATDTLSVQIVDDVPEIAPITFGTIEDGQTLSDVSLESLFGADGAGDIAFDASLNGTNVLQGGEQVFFEGEALTWSLDGDVLTATTSSNVDAITITLNDADGNYDISVAEGTFYLQGDQQTFAIGDLSGSNALAWVGQSSGIDTLIISEGTSTNTSNAGGTGYVGAGSQWIDAGTADSTTFYFYDSIDAETGAIGDQTELDAALDNSVVAGVNSFSISVNTQGGNATTLQLAFVAVDGTLGSASVEIPSGNKPSNPFLLEMDSSDITWEGGQSGLAIASVEFPAGDVDYRVGGDLVYNEITPTDIELDLPVTITDADGDVDSGNITGTITSEGVVNPLALTEIPDELYVGTNEPNSKVTEGGNDVLIGDLGGREQQFNPGKDYSIALIADESGSMAGSRNTLLEAALKSFVNDLADHDGVINIALIGFGPSASLEISVSDLADNPSGLQSLLNQIDALGADGGTNYEAAFDSAVTWFQGQPSGHEFISYFMTDGDPTLYNGTSTIRDDDFDTVRISVEAFEALSAISEVNAIGIGSGVNADYLRFFDNTNSTGTGTEVFGETISRISNFTGSADPLDTASDWTVSGDTREGFNINGVMEIEDRRGNGATVVTSAVFLVAVDGSVLQFDYETSNLGSSDELTWSLQRQEGSSWVEVSGGDLDEDTNGGSVESSLLQSGQYRLVYTVEDSGTGNASETLEIDNIELRVPEQVTGPVGQPQIINNAGELVAELQGGNTTDTPADLGDDVLVGGDGDDVIFGDTIFTDDLTWTNGDTNEEFTAGHGLGYEGLVEYLTWAENGGVAPDDAQIMQYIRDNYDSLINPNPTQAEMDAAGNDTLIGGAGNDFLIGGDGADIFQWNAGDDGSEANPAVDTVVDFDATEGDVLDVSDLLNTADASDNLDNYLVASYDAGSDQTTIDVFTGGDAQSGGQSTQSIVVNGDQQDLNALLSSGNLNVDQS